jgi:hypothetical protein
LELSTLWAVVAVEEVAAVEPVCRSPFLLHPSCPGSLVAEVAVVEAEPAFLLGAPVAEAEAEFALHSFVLSIAMWLNIQ